MGESVGTYVGIICGSCVFIGGRVSWCVGSIGALYVFIDGRVSWYIGSIDGGFNWNRNRMHAWGVYGGRINWYVGSIGERVNWYKSRRWCWSLWLLKMRNLWYCIIHIKNRAWTYSLFLGIKPMKTLVEYFRKGTGRAYAYLVHMRKCIRKAFFGQNISNPREIT